MTHHIGNKLCVGLLSAFVNYNLINLYGCFGSTILKVKSSPDYFDGKPIVYEIEMDDFAAYSLKTNAIFLGSNMLNNRFVSYHEY